MLFSLVSLSLTSKLCVVREQNFQSDGKTFPSLYIIENLIEVSLYLQTSYLCFPICTNIYVHTHVYTYMYTHMYTYMHTYTYMYICIYMYIHTYVLCVYMCILHPSIYIYQTLPRRGSHISEAKYLRYLNRDQVLSISGSKVTSFHLLLDFKRPMFTLLLQIWQFSLRKPAYLEVDINDTFAESFVLY